MPPKLVTIIPLPIGDNKSFINEEFLNIIKKTKHYAVENIKTCRRFIASLKLEINIDDLYFISLDKNTSLEDIRKQFESLECENLGLMSESGCPGIADPGQLIVKIAHEKGINVKPLIGPSSIILSLMASGLNGQNFAFIGYLPIQQNQRIHKIKELCKIILETQQTQIFIETPYRNKSLLSDIIKYAHKEIKLCVAKNLTSIDEKIICLKIKDWKLINEEFHRVPCIYLLGI
jgi:16S rRNA (cytidine1402-2'-O)-methyltransferase